jgi:hypothetical protein
MSSKALKTIVLKIVLGEVEVRKIPRNQFSAKAIYTYLKTLIIVLR